MLSEICLQKIVVMGLVPIFYWPTGDMMAARSALIEAIVAPVVQTLGFELWGIEYLGQGKHTLLRIYIEKEEGIDIDDCAQVSRQISAILDVEDPISSHYTLEVSSPGLDRMLFKIDQYKAYLGSKIKLRLTENFEGRRNFQGNLTGVIDDMITVENESVSYEFPFELIEKIIVFGDLEKKK